MCDTGREVLYLPWIIVLPLVFYIGGFGGILGSPGAEANQQS